MPYLATRTAPDGTPLYEEEVPEPPQNYIPGSTYVPPEGIPVEPVPTGAPVPEPVVLEQAPSAQPSAAPIGYGQYAASDTYPQGGSTYAQPMDYQPAPAPGPPPETWTQRAVSGTMSQPYAGGNPVPEPASLDLNAFYSGQQAGLSAPVQYRPAPTPVLGQAGAALNPTLLRPRTAETTVPEPAPVPAYNFAAAEPSLADRTLLMRDTAPVRAIPEPPGAAAVQASLDEAERRRLASGLYAGAPAVAPPPPDVGAIEPTAATALEAGGRGVAGGFSLANTFFQGLVDQRNAAAVQASLDEAERRRLAAGTYSGNRTTPVQSAVQSAVQGAVRQGVDTLAAATSDAEREERRRRIAALPPLLAAGQEPPPTFRPAPTSLRSQTPLPPPPTAGVRAAPPAQQPPPPGSSPVDQLVTWLTEPVGWPTRDFLGGGQPAQPAAAPVAAATVPPPPEPGAYSPSTNPATPSAWVGASTRSLELMNTYNSDAFRAAVHGATAPGSDGVPRKVWIVPGVTDDAGHPLAVGVVRDNVTIPAGSDMSPEDFQALVDSADPAGTPAAAASTVPEPASAAADVAHEVADINQSLNRIDQVTGGTSSGGSSKGYYDDNGNWVWYDDFSQRGGGSSGGGYGSRRGSSFEDFGDNGYQREFTADDFLEQAGGDRKKAAAMAKAANRRRTRQRGQQGGGMFWEGFPFNRPPTPIRAHVLAAIAESKAAGQARKQQRR